MQQNRIEKNPSTLMSETQEWERLWGNFIILRWQHFWWKMENIKDSYPMMDKVKQYKAQRNCKIPQGQLKLNRVYWEERFNLSTTCLKELPEKKNISLKAICWCIFFFQTPFDIWNYSRDVWEAETSHTKHWG